MATKIWYNTSSCNGLSSDGTKPLLEPMLTYHISGTLLRPILPDVLKTSYQKMILKTHLKSLPHFAGVNELIYPPRSGVPPLVVGTLLSNAIRSWVNANSKKTPGETKFIYQGFENCWFRYFSVNRNKRITYRILCKKRTSNIWQYTLNQLLYG